MALTAAPGTVHGVRASHLDALDAVTELVDDTGALVAERERESVDVLLRGQVHDEPVRVAQAGGGDLESDLPRSRLGNVDLDDLGTLADLAVLDGLHDSS